MGLFTHLFCLSLGVSEKAWFTAMLCLPALQLPTPSPVMHLQQVQQLLIPACFVKSRQWGVEKWLTPRLRNEPNPYQCYRKSCDHTHKAPGETSQASLTQPREAVHIMTAGSRLAGVSRLFPTKTVLPDSCAPQPFKPGV